MRAVRDAHRSGREPECRSRLLDRVRRVGVRCGEVGVIAVEGRDELIAPGQSEERQRGRRGSGRVRRAVGTERADRERHPPARGSLADTAGVLAEPRAERARP